MIVVSRVRISPVLLTPPMPLVDPQGSVMQRRVDDFRTEDYNNEFGELDREFAHAVTRNSHDYDYYQRSDYDYYNYDDYDRADDEDYDYLPVFNHQFSSLLGF